MLDVIAHHFIGGTYCKEMRIPDGFEVVSHEHAFDHMSVLTQGCVIVEADGIQNTYWSPAVIEIKAGVKHSVMPVNGDAHWLCIHATDCTDVNQVDNVLIKQASHMRKADFTLDVRWINQQIAKHPELWNQYDMRTKLYDNSPHREVSDIWLRYRDWKEFDPQNPQAFADKHHSVWYPAAVELPEVFTIADQVLWNMHSKAELGGVLITKIPPGKQVYPHSDAGAWHSEYYETKVLVLLQSAPGQTFNFHGESHEGVAGEVFYFDNHPEHWVVNNSDVDRISLILAVRQAR